MSATNDATINLVAGTVRDGHGTNPLLKLDDIEASPY
jgi:hypothetical protein